MQCINNFPLLVEVKDARLLRKERDREDPRRLAEEASGPPAESERLKRKPTRS